MYKGGPRTLAIFIQAWAQIGVLQVFFCFFFFLFHFVLFCFFVCFVFLFFFYKDYLGSSGAYATCIYCCLSVKITYVKKPHSMWRSWTHLVCICFCVCGWQKPEDPKLSPMADDAITQGGIWGLGSPLYICGNNTKANEP